MKVKGGKNIKCETCNKEFYVTPSRLQKNKHHTCSKSCLGKLFSKLHSRKIETKCIICDEAVFYKKSHFKEVAYPTCSRFCAAKSKSLRMKGKDNPRSLKLTTIERLFWNKTKTYAYRAEAKNIDFDLDHKFLEELFDKQKGKCYYSNYPMQLKGSKVFNTASLDRINSSKGYTKDNVVFCLNSINMLKSNHDLKEIKKVFRSIYMKEKNNIDVKYKRLHSDAKAPYKKCPDDAGYDLFVHKFEERGDRLIVYTGIAIEPQIGYYFLLAPRSSTSKKGLILHNNLGIIDNNYRGEIIGVFYKTKEFKGINVGDRLLQLLPQEQFWVEFEEVEELSSTERGEGGFGSSGA